MKKERKKSDIGEFFAFFKPHMGLFLMDMACAALASAIDLAFPYVSRLCMNKLLPERLFVTFFAVIAALRSFGLGSAIEVVERRAGLPWGQRVADILMASYKNKGIAIALCVATLGPMAPLAMVAIATSIVVEISWVIFMDSVLFSRRRMERELARDAEAGSGAEVREQS